MAHLLIVSGLGLPAQSSGNEPGTHKVEWQKPGGTLKNGMEMYAIKDSDGLVIVWNHSKPYFKLKVLGNQTQGTYEGINGYFLIDGVFMQVLSLETEQFIPSTKGLTDEQILKAHMAWEFDYMKPLLGNGASVKSWPNKLPDGATALYWEAIPGKVKEQEPYKHILVTRFFKNAVICVTSVESASTSLDKAKSLILYAISHIDFLEQRLEAPDLQRAIMENHQ